MKNAVFLDVTPCNACKNRRFGVTHHFHHQVDMNGRVRNVSSNQQSNRSHKASHLRRRHFSYSPLRKPKILHSINRGRSVAEIMCFL
jgi:hypothetical protein